MWTFLSHGSSFWTNGDPAQSSLALSLGNTETTTCSDSTYRPVDASSGHNLPQGVASQPAQSLRTWEKPRGVTCPTRSRRPPCPRAAIQLWPGKKQEVEKSQKSPQMPRNSRFYYIKCQFNNSDDSQWDGHIRTKSKSNNL